MFDIVAKGTLWVVMALVDATILALIASTSDYFGERDFTGSFMPCLIILVTISMGTRLGMVNKEYDKLS